MRVLLSTSPARYWQTTNFMLTNFPPLGLAVAAAAISPPHKVHIVENARHRFRSHNLFHEVRKFDAQVIAFTNNFYPDSLVIQRTCRELKEAFPGLVTIVGGQAPSFLPEEYIEHGVDFAVLYEAEETFKELLGFLDGTGERDICDIDGIAWRNQLGEVVVNKRRKLLQDFDDLPTDAHARGAGFFVLDDSDGVAADAWPVTQTVADPEGFHEWVLEGTVDLPASREEGRAVVSLAAIRRL